MSDPRTHIEAALEAARFQAAQAGREAALDVVSVYYAALAKLEAGLVEEAKAIVKAYREGTK
jgi:hypothetical protein